MQNNRKLYDLVASLSKSEKIYLKKFAFLHDRNKENVYLVLFDLLQKKNINTDAELLKALRKTTISQNLPSIKHYLYKHILRSLRNYYHGESANMEVKSMLEDIHVLLLKGLYSQCRSLIASTKKVALKYDMHIDYLNLLRIETKLLVMTNAEREKVNKVYDEQREVTKIINNSIDYNQLSNETWHLIFGKIDPSDRQKLARELFSHPLLNDIKNAKTFYDRSSFYFSMSRKGAFERDEKVTENSLKDNVAMWESHPHFIRENMNDYIVLLHDLTFTHYQYHDHKKNKFIQDTINKIKGLSSSSPHIQSKIFQFAYMGQQNLSINMGFFEEERKNIPEVERGLKDYDSLISYNIRLVFHINTAHILIGCGDYRSASTWLRKGLEMESKATLSDIIMVMKVMVLICYIELENFELLEFSLRSVKRKLDKSAPQSINILLEYIKSYSSANSDKRRMEQLLNSTIQKLLKICNEPNEKQIMDTFDFISYLESKRRGRPFGQVFKEKVQKML